MAVQFPRRRFTTDEFHTMIEAGVFKKDDRLELINGEIIEKTPIGRKHAVCVRDLTNFFARNLPSDVLMDVQNPLRLSDDQEFYPDLTLLKQSSNIQAGNIARPDDILLAVEVSDSTLLFDRTVKLPIFAEANVTEVWIIDLKQDRILVHRKPLDGVYGEVTEYYKGDSVPVAALANITLEVDDIL